jgi:hypothetical protein
MLLERLNPSGILCYPSQCTLRTWFLYRKDIFVVGFSHILCLTCAMRKSRDCMVSWNSVVEIVDASIES